MARIGQEGLNNFLTDHLLRFLLGCGVRAPGSAQKRHLEALLDRFPAGSKCAAGHRPIPSNNIPASHFRTFRPVTTPLYETCRERHHAIHKCAKER